MKADSHRQAALDDERAVADLGDPALKEYVRRVAIEAYWGAAFHWIAYACQQKHGKHRDNHQRLVSYLRNDIAEPDIAERWRSLEDLRNAGWYGNPPPEISVRQAYNLWQEIRAWASS